MAKTVKVADPKKPAKEAPNKVAEEKSEVVNENNTVAANSPKKGTPASAFKKQRTNN